MTLDGTNTYLIDAGGGRAVVVDPGPAIDAHIDAIEAALRDRRLELTAIAVTHGHPDHAPGAAPLHARTGAPVIAHPAAQFPHDQTLADGEPIRVGARELLALHAPGHARDHIVLWLEDEAVLFTGDVIVGRGTVVIAPPGGEMRVYQHSLERLRARFGSARTIFGGHGERVDAPQAKIEEYIGHRRAREVEIVSHLRAGPHTIPALVAAIYRDVDRVLWPAAARQVAAYLEALETEERVRAEVLDRAPSPEEATILNPDLSRLVDRETALVAAAELGIGAADAPLIAYELRA